MKKRFRQAMGFLVIAALLLISLQAFADTTGKNGLFSYAMKGNGTLKITTFDWNQYKTDTDIVIPQLIDGYTVTEIGELAFSQGDIGYNNIEKIFGSSRRYEAGDATLLIPNTVTTIGEKAFFNSGIGRVKIPASVKTIGTAAFCTGGLKSVTVEAENANYASVGNALYSKKAKELLAGSIEMTAIPEGIVSLGEFAFFDLDYVLYKGGYFSCPSSLEEIKAFAFYKSEDFLKDEPSVNKCNFKNVKKIGDYAFAQVYTNSDLIFGDALNEIGVGAFYKFTTYEERAIDFSRCVKLTYIPDKAFLCPGGSYDLRIILPSTIDHIGKEAFAEGTFREIEFIGSKPSTIDDRAFKKTETSILYSMDDRELSALLANVKTIGSEAFANCTFSGDLEIPECCSFIGENAFSKETKLKLKVQPGSYAESWAQENGYEYDNGVKPDLSWLN